MIMKWIVQVMKISDALKFLKFEIEIFTFTIEYHSENRNLRSLHVYLERILRSE